MASQNVGCFLRPQATKRAWLMIHVEVDSMESIKQLKPKFHHTTSIISISMFPKYKSIAKLHILTIIWPTVLL